MEQYIPKSALVAELEKRRESNAKEMYFGRLVEDNYFLEYINTLEVKEVDLEKEMDELIIPKLKKYKALPLLTDVAKHFFYLGLKYRKDKKYEHGSKFI